MSETTPIWTEGVCDDGAAILRDGVMVRIEDVLARLNELEEYKAYRQHEDEIVRQEREEDARWDAAMERIRDVCNRL